MHIKTILDEKGRNVLTINPAATIRDAARELHENHIGAVIVLDDGGQIKGILAERDIVAAIARFGAECSTRPYRLSCGQMSIAAPKTQASMS